MYLGIDPQYFLDKMEMYEAAALLKYGYKKHMTEYECARIGAYVTAQVNSKKPLRPQNIIKFEWEDKNKIGNKKKNSGTSSSSDIERLRKKKETMQMQFKTLPPMN